MEFGELPIGEHMHTGRFFSKLIKPKKGDRWSSDQYQLVRSTGIWRECVCVCDGGAVLWDWALKLWDLMLFLASVRTELNCKTLMS